MFLVEEFDPSQLDEVGRLGAEVLRESYAPEFFLGMHDLAPAYFLVARPFYGPRPVGFLVGSQGSSLEARLLLLAVSPTVQSRGVGRRLLEEFTRRCRRAGVRELSLEVRQSNDGAVRFYRAMGFDLVGRVDAFYSDGEAGLVMRKPL